MKLKDKVNVYEKVDNEEELRPFFFNNYLFERIFERNIYY